MSANPQRAEQSGPRVLAERMIAWLAANPGQHTPKAVALPLGASALSVRQVAAQLAAIGRVRVAREHGGRRWLLSAATLADAVWAHLNRDGWWVERAAVVRWARDEHDALPSEVDAALRDLRLAGRAIEHGETRGAEVRRLYRAVREAPTPPATAEARRELVYGLVAGGGWQPEDDVLRWAVEAGLDDAETAEHVAALCAAGRLARQPVRLEGCATTFHRLDVARGAR